MSIGPIIGFPSSGAGSGDVAGPASSNDNAIVRFDGTTGKIIQNSSALIADDGSMTVDSTSATAFLVRQAGAAGNVLIVDSRNPDSISGNITEFLFTGNGGNTIAGSADQYRVGRFELTLTSGTQTDVFRALHAQVNASGSSVSTGIPGSGPRGGHFATIWDSTGACTYQDGLSTNAVVLTSSSSIAAGTVTTQVGNRVVTGYSAGATGTGTVTDNIGALIATPQNTSAGRTITTNYGLKIEDATGTGITTGYSLYTGTGLVRFGGRTQDSKGANVASANDLTLGIDGNVFTITGTTQINAIITANWQAGSRFILIFSGALTVKHNTAGGAGTARMFLAGSADMTTAANTVLGFVYDGTQFQETFRKVA